MPLPKRALRGSNVERKKVGSFALDGLTVLIGLCFTSFLCRMLRIINLERKTGGTHV